MTVRPICTHCGKVIYTIQDKVPKMASHKWCAQRTDTVRLNLRGNGRHA